VTTLLLSEKRKLPEFKAYFDICEGLDHLAYSISGMASAVDGVRSRILSEWIKQEPTGREYGKPPVILSKPLTKTQVLEMLAQYSKNLRDDVISLENIATLLLEVK